MKLFQKVLLLGLGWSLSVNCHELPKNGLYHRGGPGGATGGVMETIKNFFSAVLPTPTNSQVDRSQSLPPKMRDLHRVPKPPKYPLYDLDSISLATPPPAPLMHPASSLPSDQFTAPAPAPTHSREHTTQQRHNRVTNRRRGESPRRPSRRPHNKNNNKNKNRRNHGNKTPSKYSPPPPPPQKSEQTYTNHPMASNLDPIKTSPALGRPLGYNEYMARPSNSFVDDPWNFDPFANQMNAGLLTSGLKYNYDPLGTNDNNIDMSHLDASKLSFLGDSFVEGGEAFKIPSQQYNNPRQQQQQQQQNYATMNSNQHGNQYNNNNHNNQYNNHNNQQYNHNNQQYNNHHSDSQNSPSMHHPILLNGHTQKIEFTIETSPDGVNIESVQPVVSSSSLSDHYSPIAAPIGPSGYTPNSYADQLTPSDMLPPVNSPGSGFYRN